jgi:hypothetical protein
LRRLEVEAVERRELLATLTVTSAADGTPGSLRATIARAVSGDVIVFSSSLNGATLRLTQGELLINKSLTIAGSGQTLDAAGHSRVLDIEGPNVNVVLGQLGITGGSASLEPSVGYAGGGLFVNNASVTLTSCVIARNTAQGKPGTASSQVTAFPGAGGGIFAQNSHVTLKATSVKSNKALGSENSAQEQAGAGDGGGIFLFNSILQVTGGTIQDNLAQGGSAVNSFDGSPEGLGGGGAGGAIFSFESNATLTGVTIADNDAVGGEGLAGALADPSLPGAGPGEGGTSAGGAIFAFGLVGQPGPTPSVLALVNDTFLRNTAQGGAAGIAAVHTQTARAGGEALGGAIEQVLAVALSLNNVLFQGNHALGGAGAPNVNGAGSNTSTGGEASGGAIDSQEPAGINGVGVRFLGNSATGGVGGSSLPQGGTEAGVGGSAVGGAWSLNGLTGSAATQALPVTLKQVLFQNNAALGGAPGKGALPASGRGAGGAATGGAMQVVGVFNLNVANTNWLNNHAIAQQGKNAAGGALNLISGTSKSQTTIAANVFRANFVRGGNDVQTNANGQAAGGAIVNEDPNTSIVNSSFTLNIAQGGLATGYGLPGYAQGGAIASAGPNGPTLALQNTRFIGNHAVAGAILAPLKIPARATIGGFAEGGAVAILAGSLTSNQSPFTNNLAQGTTSRVTGHHASGGAIFLNVGTTASVSNSLLAGNQALASGSSNAFGGAIADLGTSLSVSTTVISTNRAASFGVGTGTGGGLYVAGNASLTDVKIANNGARSAPGGKGLGGGIAYANNPQVTLARVFNAGNRANTSGKNSYGAFHSP